MDRKAPAAPALLALCSFAGPAYAHGGEGLLSLIQFAAAAACALLLIPLPKWPSRNAFAALGFCGGAVLCWLLVPFAFRLQPGAWSEAAMIAFVLVPTAALPVLGCALGVWLAYLRARRSYHPGTMR
jgi:hypothetical protein